MDEPKKKVLEEKISAKIQAKFDLVFGSSVMQAKKESTVFNDDPFTMDEDIDMSSTSAKKPQETQPKIDLDFNFDSDGTQTNLTAPVEETKSAKTQSKLTVVPNEDELDFNLDFSDEAPELPTGTTPAASTPAGAGLDLGSDDISFELDSLSDTAKEEPVAAKASDSAMELDLSESAGLDFDDDIVAHNSADDDRTKKTIVYDKSQLTEIGLEAEMDDGLSLGQGEVTGSSDLMSMEEAKANMDATIKDIIRPKSQDSTQELDISSFSNEEDESSNFNLSDDAKEATGEFDLSSVEFADKDDVPPVKPEAAVALTPPVVPTQIPVAEVKSTSMGMGFSTETAGVRQSFISDEDSSRFQATIRQLREEREELLQQLKNLKNETRELEQDNLTLKAALDETKIEISIMRKRHLLEMEDMKYRLSLNEEKKEQALEKARLAELKREKLEQKVRIDFNQVKQREKELETKLEMLTIDVDSQVHSRDQKILELRRKIDALEFNMENVSIKEQKSIEDKRKLEDKLNKIMKTLRHSIKNLEEDMDTAHNEGHEATTGDQRSSKT